MMMGFAEPHRSWRRRRGLSPLQLSGLADVSARHLNWPESDKPASGRAKVLELADALTAERLRHWLATRTSLFSGRPARGIVKRLMRELGQARAVAPALPFALAALAPRRAAAEGRHLSDFSPLWAGQNTRGCRAIGAAELTRQLATASERA